MVRSLSQIEQEMAALQQTVASIAEEFHDTYGQYLDALGQAVRQQLILACYHLCTHGYPDAFLSLTFSQRQELQQKLRQLSQQAQDDITSHLQPIVPRDLSGQQLLEDSEEEDEEDEEEEEEDGEEELNLGEAIDRGSADAANLSRDFGDMDLPTALRFIQQAMASQRAESEDSKLDDSTPDMASPEPQSDHSLFENSLDNSTSDIPADSIGSETKPSENTAFDRGAEEPPEATSGELGEESDPESNEPFNEPSADQPPIEDRPLTPKDLLYWQDRTEKAIMAMLYELSHAANRMIHQAKVLPNQFPEPILEVAAKADMSAETVASPPNLLSLMIEARPEGSKRSTMTPIIVVRLRLSEIEFANSSVSVWRSRIRELSARLSKVGRDYYQKQKERSTAQAEAAWRASWFEG